MNWHISDEERTYLRELAKRQADIAALPVMAERAAKWLALNDGKPDATPMVLIEATTFKRDFMPDGILRCTSETGRKIEYALLNNIRKHEEIDDDTVCPSTFDISWFMDVDEFGVPIPIHRVADSQGVDTGYSFDHPIQNLERDFEKLKPAQCAVDRETTAAWQTFCEELLGDLLPVVLRTAPLRGGMITQKVIHLMGMEAFFMAMYECPETLHRLMAYLRDNALRQMRWAEDEGLLRLNNGNQVSFGSSPTFTEQLPAPGYEGPAARLCDMWWCANSQETVGISPKIFNEFCFPYYRDVVEPVGLLYYGCCEPAHPFWGDLSRLPHLRKISISSWCDEKFMGDALRGTGIVYSRKPHPRFIGVDKELDEDAFRAHIRETLEAADGCQVEIIYRDVYTVHGNLGKPRRAVEIMCEEIASKLGA